MAHHSTRILLAAAALAITAPATAVAATHATEGPAELSPPAAAVSALTNEPASVAAAAIPADFVSVMGYQPEVRDGRLIDPDGGCSSPFSLPAAFAAACAEHDLGYDLLRYAELTDAPVGDWARQAVDGRLEERMRATCAQRPSGPDRSVCAAAATIATAGIELNSMRQLQQVPEETVGSLLVTALAGAAAVAGLVAVLSCARRRRDRRHNRRRPCPARTGRGVPA